MQRSAALICLEVDNIEECGPPWALAMWAFERLWGVLTDQNQSQRFPASSMMQNVRAFNMAHSVLARQDPMIVEGIASPDAEMPSASHSTSAWYASALNRSKVTLSRRLKQ